MTLSIAELAVRALLTEAALSPKPGLVTPYSNGSHKDMNFRMFVGSALALFEYFAECASIGKAFAASPPGETLAPLRKAGADGELAMYRATGGVNTHKGAIYLVGLLCAAAGRLLPRSSCFSPQDLAGTAASFVQGVVERELLHLKHAANKKLTAGERAYVELGFTGARGEAERGYPLTLEALSFWERRSSSASFRDSLAGLTDTFFFIVAKNDDTNLYARGGVEGVRTARVTAEDILQAGGSASCGGAEKIRLAEKIFIEKNLSPGGSADILSCTVLLSRYGLPSLL